jgi:hypothetical protein
MNRVIPLLALAVMLAFFAVFLWRVPRLDLGAVIVITMALAIYDIWSQIRRR